jgi:hypothetical protein
MNTWKKIAIACLSLTVLGVAPAGAAPPQIKVTAATPASAEQGTIALDVVVSGSGFDKSAKVQFFVSGTTNPGGIIVRNVKFNSSSELITTIDVADTAELASFDIQVTLSSGRKGKGTTLFRVAAKPKPNDPLPVPTYPAARAWHSFTSNSATTTEASRLYMYGGAGADWQAVPPYFWFYGAHADRWTLVTPDGTTSPGPRQWSGLACGAGACVLATGSNGVGLVDETWVYREATNAWTKSTCRRGSYPCPSPRQMATVAFDPQRNNYLLFGGRGSALGLDDTLTFDAATLKWTVRSPRLRPSERNRAAAAYVPGVGVVMHGGQPWRADKVYCDLFAWTGSDWTPILYDAQATGPCLHSHSMVWDGTGLVLAGGFVDTSDTPSPTNWRFTFAADGRSGNWSQSASETCAPVLGTDAEIHPGARMAYDIPTATRVWFGGEESVDGVGLVRYDNTVECY